MEDKDYRRMLRRDFKSCHHPIKYNGFNFRCDICKKAWNVDTVSEVSMELKNCPFCGGEAEQNSHYDSDDNRPDGEQLFIECKSCGARSSDFYVVTINDMHLNEQQRKQQNSNIQNQCNESIKAWNKRIFPTQNYKYT
jgi:hypothetical protein